MLDTAPVVLDRGILWLVLRCPCGQRVMVSAADGVTACRRCGQAWRYVAATAEAVHG